LTDEEMLRAYQEQQEQQRQQREAEAAKEQAAREEAAAGKQRAKMAVVNQLRTDGFIFTPILTVRSAWAPPAPPPATGTDGGNAAGTAAAGTAAAAAAAAAAAGTATTGKKVRQMGVRLEEKDDGQLVIEFQLAFGPGPLGIIFRPSTSATEKGLAPAVVLELPVLRGTSRRTDPATGKVV
jgi:hypothetical protein